MTRLETPYPVRCSMKYMIAWLLGVPAVVLVIIWLIFG
jgi:hypothetical protein